MLDLFLKHKKLLSILLLLTILEVSLSGGIGLWREYFWNSVQNKELNKFLLYIGEFLLMALAGCGIAGISTYLLSYLSLLVRTDLTAKALITHYHRIEGSEQRIQEDCAAYPFLALGLVLMVLKNVLLLIVFTTIVVRQAGVVYLLVPIAVAISGTFLAGLVAKPLTVLNYQMQVIEAKFRQYILHRKTARKDNEIYKTVFDINKDLYVKTKRLTYFQSFYNQTMVVVPYLILAPVYFTGKITFGIFMQIASSISMIIDSLSCLVNAFGDINKFLSCRKRLKEMNII